MHSYLQHNNIIIIIVNNMYIRELLHCVYVYLKRLCVSDLFIILTYSMLAAVGYEQG